MGLLLHVAKENNFWETFFFILFGSLAIYHQNRRRRGRAFKTAHIIIIIIDLHSSISFVYVHSTVRTVYTQYNNIPQWF